MSNKVRLNLSFGCFYTLQDDFILSCLNMHDTKEKYTFSFNKQLFTNSADKT